MAIKKQRNSQTVQKKSNVSHDIETTYLKQITGTAVTQI
jgi:hypothetical protein